MQHNTERDGHEDGAGKSHEREATRKAYDRISGLYDVITAGAEGDIRKRGIEMMRLREGENVLEVGSGTGEGLIQMAGCVGKSGKVHGLDLSGEMVNITLEKIRKNGLEELVKVTVGDAVDLPFRDEVFDAVFMSFTLELFPDDEIIEVLSECRRVLRDGGRIGLVSISSGGQETTARRIYKWAHEMFPVYVDCRPISAEHFLKQCGFEILESERRKLYGIPVDVMVGGKGAKIMHHASV